MARRSLQVADVAAPRSSSKRPTPAETATEDLPSKRAKRQSASKTTKYVAPESSEDELEEEQSASDAHISGYEDSEVAESEDEDVEDVESASEVSESDGGARRRSGVKSRNSKSVKAATPGSGKVGGKTDLLRPGVKLGMGPGIQVVIKKPRARSPGGTQYKDETIHPNSMLFLQDLAANNDRQWLKMHDLDYRASWKDFESFLESLTERIAEVDETIPELPTKDIIFRIYRDVRFSKDQTPYKTAFSAAWSRTGRKGPYAVYYLQIKPNGGSMIAGGLWMPEAAALASLRRDIDRRPQRMKAILTSAEVRKEFLGGVSNNDKKVVQKFVDEHSETNLKTKPKGYDADHKDIALLRLRNFTLHRKLSDEEILSSNGIDRIVELISHIVPFITYLNSVVMPDDPSENDGSDEEVASD